MKKIILLIFVFSAFLYSADLNGSLSTGFYWGTPFWNADNTAENNKIQADDTFMRSVNQLRLNWTVFNNFSIKLHALRSDGFQSENRLSETKIYQVYGQYQFGRGQIRAGRFAPLNRWLHGALDGGAIAFSVTPQIKLNVIGGRQVRFGKWYESDDLKNVVYGDIGWKSGRFGGKLKAYHDKDMTKAGADFFGAAGKLTFNGNYGYNVTAGHLADGGLNLYLPVGKKLSVSANYLAFRTEESLFRFFEFDGYLIERVMAGLHYKLFSSYYVDLRQMVTMTSEQKNYLTYLTMGGHYINFGVNYLTGDSDLKRLGLTLGGRYTFFNALDIAGGVSPVDYLFQDEESHEQSISYYLRVGYRFLGSFALDANFNFYQQNKALDSSMRGGLQLRYNFGS